MSLDADARTTAIVNAIINANATLPTLSADEQASIAQTMRANIATVFGTDLSYLVASTVVSVNTTSNIQPSTIATAGSPTAQVGPPAVVPVTGSGNGTIG